MIAFGAIGNARGAGVTVITHGFNSNVTDWIIPMAEAAPHYPSFPGTTYSCYEISITRNGSGQYVAAATFLGGTQPALADSGEILIKLDWSTLSSLGGTSSTNVANAAASALLSTTLIPAMGGRPLAQLPLHLIGHSRGGSVVTEMARLLGAQGVWVDQVTTLDPRPVATFGDASVTSYANVLFADNYWQTMGDGLIVPNGQSVFGAYNRKLLDLNGGYSSSHSDVHLWYHGTIDLATPATDTQATITATQRATWWTSQEMAGAATGFFYSLIGGGDRLSNIISDGFNKNWDFGGGLAPNRTALSVNSGLWPNVIRFFLADSEPVPAGETFTAPLYYQSGPSAAGEVQFRIFLDADFNPTNGNEIEIDQGLLPNTGTNAVALAHARLASEPRHRRARDLCDLRPSDRWRAHALFVFARRFGDHAEPATAGRGRKFPRSRWRDAPLQRSRVSRTERDGSRDDRPCHLGPGSDTHLHRNHLGIYRRGRGQIHASLLSRRADAVAFRHCAADSRLRGPAVGESGNTLTISACSRMQALLPAIWR